MNLIQNQAEKFYLYEYRDSNNYQEFIQELRGQLIEYHKDSHQLEFIDHIIHLLKKNYELHLEKCKYKDGDRLKCSQNEAYENSLFFAQNEKDKILDLLDPNDFNFTERESVSKQLAIILESLNKLELGQEITYDDLTNEFEDMKEHFYLSKKPWSQMFVGKLSEMVVAGVISETVSKDIIELVENSYNNLI